MTLFLSTLFAGWCFFLLGWGMWQRGRVCEFPFLAGATFAGFVLPQVIGISSSQGPVPPGFDAALVTSILCAVMCYVGYVVCDTPLSSLRLEFDERRLLIVSGALSVVGTFFFFLIRELPDELVATGGWSGLVVAYYFFAQVLRYGFALAVLLYVKTRSKPALAIVLFDCLSLFDMIVLRGRRYYTIEFVMVILCTFWLVRRATLPRWTISIILPVGILAMWGAATYRATVYQDQAYGGALKHDMPWEQILEIDFVDVFLKSNQDEPYEFRNLSYCIHATDSYDCGLSYWNELVYIYVPAQVVGPEFKTSLQFDLPGEVTDPDSTGGTTVTGMADSYQAFGWFGCLVFFLIAYAMRRLFATAQDGHVAAQLAYMLIVTSSLHTVTHHTKWFVVPWVHMVVFLLPCLLWARKAAANECQETNELTHIGCEDD